MKIIAFGASYSKDSINKKFATFTAQQFSGNDIEILDLDQYTIPLYTIDTEKESGHPQLVKDFVAKIESADFLIISMSEHNGSYTAAFKNLFDWSSRVKQKVFEGKKILLLSTAPGPRGGLGALEAAKTRFPIHGAEIIAHYTLPVFQTNFSETEGILQEELKGEYDEVISSVKEILHT